MVALVKNCFLLWKQYDESLELWLREKFYDCYDVEEVLKEVRCTPQQIMEDILK